MASTDGYHDELGRLLPPGAVWTRVPGSTLDHLLGGFADELSRADGRTVTLLDEADPLSALELLPEWERVAGLPDVCVPVADTIRDRQVAVARKMAGLGGQTRGFFIDLAERLGVEVTIEEFAPFQAGRSRAGTPCYDAAWRHVWRVRVLASSESSGDPYRLRFSYFRSGLSRSGDRLRAGGIASLECIIKRAAPAHSTVLFGYPVDPEPVLWFDFLTQ